MASYLKFRRVSYSTWNNMTEPRDPDMLFLISDEALLALGDTLFTAKDATTGFTGNAAANELVLSRKNGDDLVITQIPFLVDGLIPANQVPLSIDKIEAYDTFADFPATGADNIVYKDREYNTLYRWDGDGTYQSVADFISLGETSTTAYRGDRGAAAYAERGSQIAGDFLTWQDGKLNIQDPVYSQSEVDALVKDLEDANLKLKTLLYSDASELLDGGEFGDPYNKLVEGGMFTDTQYSVVDGGVFVEPKIIIDGGDF